MRLLLMRRAVSACVCASFDQASHTHKTPPLLSTTKQLARPQEEGRRVARRHVGDGPGHPAVCRLVPEPQAQGLILDEVDPHLSVCFNQLVGVSLP